MRIIGGSLKGRNIMPPRSFTARPTTDFAKEGLFNVLENSTDITSITVLDLFAGSGSISLEFVSRGCPLVTCVEMNPVYTRFIKDTVAALDLSSHIRVVRNNVFDFLKICKESFDLVFADPPYDLAGLESLPDKVLGANILHKGHYFILEHGKEHSFKSHPKFLKERIYGRVHFSFFEA